MNHLKKGVLALALVAGISGAFAQKMSKSSVKQVDQIWELFDQSGNSQGYTPSPLSEAEVRDLTGCEGVDNTKCAVGESDSFTIYYN